jgi:DNA ligase (NAD+)
MDILVEKLQRANWAYHNTDKPSMTDDEYDRGLEELRRLSPAHPFLSVIGAAPPGQTILLPYPMASLDKVRCGEDMVARWLKRFTGDDSKGYVVTEKLDGLSAMYVRQGRKESLYLRGDGVKGVCVSSCLKLIQGIPSSYADCIVRGELLLPIAATPAGSIGRSLVNGWVHKSLGTSLTAPDDLRAVHFVAYQLLEPARLARQQQLTWLSSQGFKTPWTVTYPAAQITDASLLTVLEDRRRTSIYPLDGIVVGTNTIPAKAGGGEAKNPADAMAFKAALDEQREETTVIAVEWNLSRQGNWIPRVQLEPVEIGGATIQWVSGHNAAAIQEGGLGPGARIILRRSGDVIPTIEKVLSPSPSGAAMPSPATEGAWEWDATHVHARRCEGTTEGAQEALAQALLHALQTLEVDGVGPGLVKKMVAAGITTLKALWEATPQSLAGPLGPTRSTQVLTSLRERRNAVSPVTLLIASNLLPRGVGERKLRALAAVNADPAMWTRRAMDGLAGWSSESLDSLFAVLPAALEWCASSVGAGPSPTASPAAGAGAGAGAGTAVAGTAAGAGAGTVPVRKGQAVFTGVRDKVLEAQMTAAGWEIAPSVTSATTIVIVADIEKGTGQPTGKVLAAKKKGIEICKLSDFRARV